MSSLCRPFVVPLSSLCRPSVRRFEGLTKRAGACYPISGGRLDLRCGSQESVNVALKPGDLYRVGGFPVQVTELIVKQDRVHQGTLAYAADTGIVADPFERIALHPERGALQGLFYGALIRAFAPPFGIFQHLADVWQEV